MSSIWKPYPVRYAASLYPVRHKQIGVSCASVVAVAAEDDLLAVRRKHRKGIKNFVVRNLLEPGAIFIDHVQVKLKASHAFVI